MITKHLEECIAHIPSGKWFSADDVLGSIKRTDWVLKRLTEEGVLKSKSKWVNNDPADLSTKTIYYRIK